MSDTFALVGMLFVVAVVLVCVGGLYEAYKGRLRITEEGVFKALGIAGVFVLIIVGFGAGVWLILTAYSAVLSFAWRVSELLHLPFSIVLCLPILAIFAAGLIYRRRGKP
jgi:hypothetical protein